MANIQRDSDGTLPAYAWPGGYPIFYITADSGVLCPDCANNSEQTRDPVDPQWRLMGQDVNYEDPNLFCDHCDKRIESAYAEDETEDKS